MGCVGNLQHLLSPVLLYLEPCFVQAPGTPRDLEEGAPSMMHTWHPLVNGSVSGAGERGLTSKEREKTGVPFANASPPSLGAGVAPCDYKEVSIYYGLNCVPSKSPAPKNVFGDRAFGEVIKLKWGH